MKKKILTLLLPAAAMVVTGCGKEPDPEHQHSFDTSKWETSETEHWHQCSCGAKSDVGEHKDENKDGKCDQCLKDMSQPSPENKELEKFNELVASIKSNHNYTLSIHSLAEGLEDQELNYHRYNLNNKAWYHDSSEYFDAEGIIYQKDQGYVSFAKNVDYVIPMSLADDFDYETDPRIFTSTNKSLGISDLTEVIGENLFIGDYQQDASKKAKFKTTSIDNRAVAAYFTQYYAYIPLGTLQIADSMDAVVDVTNSSITLELKYTLYYFDEVECEAPGVITIKLENVGSTSDEVLESYIADPSYVFEAPTAWPEYMDSVFNEMYNGVTPTLPSGLSYASVCEKILYDGFYYAGIQDLNSGDLRTSYGQALESEGFTKISSDSYKKVEINGVDSVTYKVLMKYDAASTLYPKGEMKILFRADKTSGVFASIADFNAYLASKKYDELVPSLPNEATCTSISNFKDTTDNEVYALKCNLTDTFKVNIPDYAKAQAFVNTYANALIAKGYSSTSKFLSMTNYSLEWSTAGSYVAIDFPATAGQYTGYVGIRYVVYKADEQSLRPSAKHNVSASPLIEHGSISFGGVTQFAAGSTVNFTISPASGYEFESASIVGKSITVTVNGNKGSFVMPDDDAVVLVTFKEKAPEPSYPINASGDNFTVDHYEDISGHRITSYTYDVENCILVYGHFDSGYTYESASLEGDDSVGCDCWDESGFDVVMIYPSKQLDEYNITIVAKSSAPAKAWHVQADSAIEHGSISFAESYYDTGEKVEFSVIPDSDYKIDSVSSNPSVSITDEGDGKYSFLMPASDVTVSASFSLVSSAHFINSSVTGSGLITNIKVNNESATSAESGDSVQFDAKPSDSTEYRVSSVSIVTDGGDQVDYTKKSGHIYFTMPDDNVTINASFEPIPWYSITKNTSHCNIQYNSGVSNNKGKAGFQVAFKVIGVQGYNIDPSSVIVTVDETGEQISVGKDFAGNYLFTMPEGSVTITAVCDPVSLKSIELSGVKTAFSVDDEFSTAGLVVTATMSDGSTKTVTPTEIDSSKVDMSKEGTYEVTVSYTENDVTASAKYDITVSQGEPPVEKWSGVFANTSVLTFDEDGTGNYTYGENVINFTWTKLGNKITIIPEADYDEDNFGQRKIFFGDSQITVTLADDGESMTVLMGSNKSFASNKKFNKQ